MKILVTGSSGFLGQNLVPFLLQQGYEVVTLSHTESDRLTAIETIDYVIHLAGVTRPKQTEAFYTGNVQYLARLLQTFESHPVPFILASSVQAAMLPPYGITPYGQSKRQAEDALLEYCNRHNLRPLIYRLPHLFGPHGTPDYNNVTHTFCYRVAHNLPLRVDNPASRLTLLYVGDLLPHIHKVLTTPSLQGFLNPTPLYERTLQQLLDTLASLKKGVTPEPIDTFSQKLYLTYLSYCDNEEA